jgi:hypothetical protein
MLYIDAGSYWLTSLATKTPSVAMRVFGDWLFDQARASEAQIAASKTTEAKKRSRVAPLQSAQRRRRCRGAKSPHGKSRPVTQLWRHGQASAEA